MKLYDQVCSLEQAKRLKEYGIIQESEFYYRGIHIWHYKEVTDWSNQEEFFELMKSELERANIFAAFTASELGEMLPCEPGIIAWEVSYNDHLGCWNCALRDLVKWEGGGSIPPIAYESEADTMAESMADTLIHCLENKLITPEQVNNKLSQL